MPFFFAEVAKHLKLKLPGLRVLLLGDGPEREALLADLRAAEIDFHYAGYVSQAALPTYYAAAKILLFPTKLDPWGLVANEACAVGVPVITCANAGVAGDLILHGYNGYILELDATPSINGGSSSFLIMVRLDIFHWRHMATPTHWRFG